MIEPDVSNLLSVAEAIAIIDQAEVSPRVIAVSLADADGLVLVEAIRADRDGPPFDKSLMDGFAVRAADVAAPAELRVIGEVAAGQEPTAMLQAGEAMAIMTGAPLPGGADAVVPVEQTRRSGDRVRIDSTTAPGRAIARRGSDVRAGQIVLEPGIRLGPAQLAASASVGAAQVRVFARPRAAVLATGDELIAIDQQPTGAQIRNTNSLMLVALLKRLGCDVIDLGVARDQPDLVRAALARGLEHDLLLVTGGMSMGQYDYVPRLLIELGVELRITKLKIKPGKPFVFGVKEGSGVRVQDSVNAKISSSLNPEPLTLNPSVVFGLPGNPVSAFVCAVRFAGRLIARMSGTSPRQRWIEAALGEPLGPNGSREFYQPVILREGVVHPLAWKGSADLYTLALANGLLVRPENDPPRASGAPVRVLEL